MNELIKVDSQEKKELIEIFKTGKSENTLKSYLTALEDFSDFMRLSSTEDAIHKFFELDGGKANLLVNDYRQVLLEKARNAPSTINRKLSAIRSVVKLGRMLGLISWQIEVKNLPATSYKDTSGPGSKTIETLIHQLRVAGSNKAIRDIAILRLFHDLGLRRAELSRLNFEDLIPTQAILWVQGKGKLEKEALSLPEPTMEALLNWLKVRGQAGGALFYSLDKGSGKNQGERSMSDYRRLSGQGIWKIITTYGKSLGIKIRPHGIRHTAITNAVEMTEQLGLTLDQAMDFSRHKRIDTLLIYRDRIDNVQGKLANAIAKKVQEK